MRRMAFGFVAILIANTVAGCASTTSDTPQAVTFVSELGGATVAPAKEVVALDSAEPVATTSEASVAVQSKPRPISYCYLSWEYADRSTDEFPISIQVGQNGKTDLLHFGEKNVTQVESGHQTIAFAAVLSKKQSSPPLNLELALEPRSVTRLVVITNKKGKDKAIEVVVYDEREEVIQRRFGPAK